MKEKVYENLVKFYNNVNDTGAWKYDIYARVEDFPSIVYLGYSYQDRLNIFKMLYLDNCTLEDLQNMTLKELMEYIEETDDYFIDDVKYFNKCIELIKMYDEN